MARNILVIGSLNMDMVMNMERMPVSGETVTGKELTYIPGGKGANQACAAGRLGGKVSMLGCVGSDEFGNRLKQSLKDCGVDHSGIRNSNQGTGTASIYVDKNGDNSIVVIPGANHTCDIAYLKEMDKALSDCDYVLLQLEIPMDAVCYAVKRAKELGKVVILNPAPAPESLPEELLPLIDYLTPNETELLTLSGRKDEDMVSIEQGAVQLIKLGIKNVIVTMGSQGCMLVQKDRAAVFPARHVEPVDTTAAGDCFNGAFTVALAEGACQEDAIRFANLASSIAVTRKGAQDSLPGRDEVEGVAKQLEAEFYKEAGR